MESTLTGVQIPAKANADFLDHYVALRYVTLPFSGMIQRVSVKCKESPVYGVF